MKHTITGTENTKKWELKMEDDHLQLVCNGRTLAVVQETGELELFEEDEDWLRENGFPIKGDHWEVEFN